MPISEYVGEDGTSYVNEQYHDGDFRATVYDADDLEQHGSAVNNEEELKLERKRKIKSDILTVLASAAINLTPIIIDNIKHRKDPVPYRQNKPDVLRFGISMVVPTLQLVDTVAFNSKLQTTLKSKTPFSLSDVNNAVNLIQTYPSTHKCVVNYLSNVSRQSAGQQQVITNDTTKRDAWFTCLNLISPYIMNKMSDDRLNVVERFASIIPIKMFGNLVRKFASTNPTLQNVYNMTTTCLQVADFGNKKINTAVRSNNGMNTAGTNTLSAILDVAQDAMGMSRGNISRFNDGYYDGWNGGSRFNNL
jgi:hypothetical protein